MSQLNTSAKHSAAAGLLRFNGCFYWFAGFLGFFSLLFFLFHEQSSKMCTQHSPLQECGGVLHDDCNTRLACLMFARCGRRGPLWKNATPPVAVAGITPGREQRLLAHKSRWMMGKTWFLPGLCSSEVQHLFSEFLQIVYQPGDKVVFPGLFPSLSPKIKRFL